MADAPERIWLRWETGAAVTQGPLTTHPDYTGWVRADLHAAAVRQARADALREAAKVAHNNRLSWLSPNTVPHNAVCDAVSNAILALIDKDAATANPDPV